MSGMLVPECQLNFNMMEKNMTVPRSLPSLAFALTPASPAPKAGLSGGSYTPRTGLTFHERGTEMELKHTKIDIPTIRDMTFPHRGIYYQANYDCRGCHLSIMQAAIFFKQAKHDTNK